MYNNILQPQQKLISLWVLQRRAAHRAPVERCASRAVQGPSARKTFAQGFCERFGCAREDYLRVALKHCLHLQARVWFSLFPSGVGSADVELIEDTGTVTTAREFRDLLREYSYRLQLSGGFAARRLKMRVSCERLQRLWKRAMDKDRGPVGA